MTAPPPRIYLPATAWHSAFALVPAGPFIYGPELVYERLEGTRSVRPGHLSGHGGAVAALCRRNRLPLARNLVSPGGTTARLAATLCTLSRLPAGDG